MAKSQQNYLAPQTSGRQSHPNRQPTDYASMGQSVAGPSTPSAPDFGGGYQPLGTSVRTPATPSTPGFGTTAPTPQPLGQPVDQAAVLRQHLLNRQTAPPIDPNAYATAGGYRVAQNVALHQQRHPNAALGMLQQPTPVPSQQPGVPTTNVPTPGSPTPGGGMVPGQPTTNVPSPNGTQFLEPGAADLGPLVIGPDGTITHAPGGILNRGLPRGFTGTPYPGGGGQSLLDIGVAQYNPGAGLPPGWSYDQSGNVRQNGYDGTVRDANGQPQYNPGTQQGGQTQYNPGYDRAAYDQQALANARRLFMLGGGGLAPNALESQDPTQLALLQSAAKKSGVDWNRFMRDYAASRLQQGGAQQA